MTASRKNSHEHHASERVARGSGSFYRVCTRCGRDSDEVMTAFRQLPLCPLVRGDWLCGRCRKAHQTDCPGCRSMRAKAFREVG